MRKSNTLDFFDISCDLEILPENELFKIKGGNSDIDHWEEIDPVDVIREGNDEEEEEETPWDQDDSWENEEPWDGDWTDNDRSDPDRENHTDPNKNEDSDPPYKKFNKEQLLNALKAIYGTKTSPQLEELGIPSNKYIADWIGGKVQENFNNDPAYRNTCALTLSLVLNLLGGEHSLGYKEGQTSSGDFNRDGTQEWYYYRASDLRDHLINTYGEAKKYDHTDDIPQGKQGFIYYSEFYGSDGLTLFTHIDYWNNGDVMGGADYSDQGGQVFFIEIN